MRGRNLLHHVQRKRKLVGRVCWGRKPADIKDVLSIINEVSLFVAKRINRRAPLRAVLRIYYDAENENDFYSRSRFQILLRVSAVYHRI